jgi:hypothetical protein
MHNPSDIEYCLKVAIGMIASPVPPRFKNKPISLANYDVSFVNNAVKSINAGEGLSDRQRELSIKLVGKYTRQYKKLGVDVTEIVKNPIFTSPLRQVDRTRFVETDMEKIYVKFPYNKEMMNSFRLVMKTVHTNINEWNKETKQYELEFNEYNLLHVYNWSKKYRFKYQDTVEDLINQFQDIINNRGKYAIQLVVTDEQCYLNNAPESLETWWKDNMVSADYSKQVTTAADQNIDVVNKSTTFKLSSNAFRMLHNRGGTFSHSEHTILDIIKAAKELGFKRIAYVVDGRTVDDRQKEQFAETIDYIGNDKAVCQVKHLNSKFSTTSWLNNDVEFAILDSVQRYSHPKNNVSWTPEFIIVTNSITRNRPYENNNCSPWVCYYSDLNKEVFE